MHRGSHFYACTKLNDLHKYKLLTHMHIKNANDLQMSDSAMQTVSSRQIIRESE